MTKTQIRNLLRELRGMTDAVLHSYASAASRIIQRTGEGEGVAERAHASDCLKLAHAAMRERRIHLLVADDQPRPDEPVIMIFSEEAMRSLLPTQAPENYTR